MNEQDPEVGEVVHYKDDDPGNPCHAAIITRVYPEPNALDLVGLTVFNGVDRETDWFTAERSEEDTYRQTWHHRENCPNR